MGEIVKCRNICGYLKLRIMNIETAKCLVSLYTKEYSESSWYDRHNYFIVFDLEFKLTTIIYKHEILNRVKQMNNKLLNLVLNL